MFFSRYRRVILALVIFAVLDTIAVGAGMGVPFFAILFGFLVGWFVPKVVFQSPVTLQQTLRRVLAGAALTSALTFLLMLLIWAPITSMLFDPKADLANFGIPMLLYEPRASFIGWIVLMIVISPFLQMLATVFGACLELALVSRRPGENLAQKPNVG